MGDMNTGGESVLVTGGSGFIGAHCILQLLGAGYRVRTTVRSLAREGAVRAMLKAGGAEPGEGLSSSPPPIWRPMPDGRKPSPVATMCCMWHRRFRERAEE